MKTEAQVTREAESAYLDGRTIHDNPYAPGTVRHVIWHDAYVTAEDRDTGEVASQEGDELCG